MTTFHILLADAGVLLAVLSALMAAGAWGVASWDAGLRGALVFFSWGWAALATAMFAAAMAVPATLNQSTPWRILLIGISNVAFLWNAGFMFGALRRVVGLGPYPLARLRTWLVGYALVGFGGALLALDPGTDTLERQARLLVLGWCAILYTSGAAVVSRDGWRRPMHALLAIGSLGCAAALLGLSALLPAFKPGAPTPKNAMWLPALTLAAFMAFALGMLLYAVRQRRVMDRHAAESLALERARATESAASLEAAMDAIGDAVVQLDLSLNLQAWNGVFEQLTRSLGVIPTAGLPCQVMMVPETKPLWEDAWRDIIDGRPSQFRMQRTFGTSQRTIDVRASPNVRGGVVVGGVAVLRDITDVVELEGRFHHAQRSEAVGRLAHGVAHDFNNLLSALFMTLEMAEDEADPRLVFRDIRTIADRGRDLTRQLLDMARRQPGGEPETFVLRDRLLGLVSVLRRMLAGEVVLEVGDIAPALQVRMGTGHFDQVLLNLVVNARDAMPDGGTIRMLVDRLQDGPTEMVRLRVVDTGRGMSPEVIARAFEPYFTTKGVGTGTGLGLSTCRDLVRQAGGEMAIESAPGRGTTIIVLLPLAAAGSPPADPVRNAPDRAPATAVAEPNRAAPEPATGAVAIIADDDPLVRRSMHRVLARLGYRAIACGDGREALTAFRTAGDVSLIITDVLMPHLDGPTWIRAMRAEGGTARVLFVSGYDGERVNPALLETLHADFLHKPFTSAQLSAAIASDEPRTTASR